MVKKNRSFIRLLHCRRGQSCPAEELRILISLEMLSARLPHVTFRYTFHNRNIINGQSQFSKDENRVRATRNGRLYKRGSQKAAKIKVNCIF